jgi:enoyl-CoA hydratase/carnithine racemase
LRVELLLPEESEDEMDYTTLRYETEGHVVTLTYDRPDQHNAINRAMNEELHHAWQRFRDDEAAFVLVITGAGESTFCAGWDLQDAADLDDVGDYDAFRVSLYNSRGRAATRARPTSSSR